MGCRPPRERTAAAGAEDPSGQLSQQALPGHIGGLGEAQGEGARAVAPQEVLEKLVHRINENAGRLGIERATFQFVLTGERGGAWVVSLANGLAELREGRAEQPDLTVELSEADFQEMVAGRLGALAAFMSGRLRVRGDLGLAMRLQPLLS